MQISKGADMKEVRNIERATLNGRQVKLFEVWELVDNAWIFSGKFSAPVKIANKNLLQYAEGQE